jgi:hypothetical protein
MAPRPAKYRGRHDKLRAQWKKRIAAKGATCARCGGTILPGEAFDLGHKDGGKPWEYQGVEHVSCNRRTSAHRAGKRAASEPSGLLSGREWASLPERERDWRSGDLNPRRRHSRVW